jgi:DNA-binding NtrC family response regulator
MTPRRGVLVVDDHESIRLALRVYLTTAGYEVIEASTAREAEERAGTRRPDVAVLDWQLPDAEAPALIPRLRALDPDLPIVILTGHGSIDRAVVAMKQGADHFLTKPVALDALEVIVSRLVDTRRERRALAATSRSISRDPDPFLGTSALVRKLADDAARVADSPSPILILGETGSGKGVLARWLHARSSRGTEAFVHLNCAGLSRELVESELFGHERGAFTGAVASKQGLLEVAHRGHLFLDEIGDLDAAVQPKLLTVLEDKRFRRVGEVRERSVDVRLVAASHRDLRALVQSERFRADLFFRISSVQLDVPPLRARREDVPPIARALLERLATELGRGPITLAPDAERALTSHSWPGNVRELRNVLERALLFVDGSVLGAASLRFQSTATAPSEPASDGDDTLAAVEKRHIERILAAEGGSVPRAATRLGIPRSTLYERMKRLGLRGSRP